jgi:hypothetical protein
MSALKTAFGEVSGEVEYFESLPGNLFQKSFDAKKITTDAETFKLALNVMTEAYDGTLKYINKNGHILGQNEMDSGTVELGFKNLGTALGDLARTDLPLASTKFRDMVTQFKLTDDQAAQLLTTMPEFKNVLRESAAAANGLTGDQNLLNIAFGRGEDSANAVATQVYGIEGAAKAAQTKIQELKNKIFDFGTVTLDTRAANREFQAAIDNVTTSIIQNGKGMDITTEAGRNNQAALDSLVTSGKDYVNSLYEQDKNSTNAQKNLDDLRIKVKKAAEQMGLGTTAAQDLADELVGTKFDIKITLDELTQAEIDAAALRLQSQINKTPGFKWGEWWKLPSSTTKDTPGMKNGGLVKFASGGIAKFAPGGPVFGAGTGTSDSIPAMLSNGEYVVNARATAKNRGLLEQINSGQTSTSNGANVNIVVNSAPGMDVNELTSEISRRLSFNLRKGASI